MNYWIRKRTPQKVPKTEDSTFNSPNKTFLRIRCPSSSNSSRISLLFLPKIKFWQNNSLISLLREKGRRTPLRKKETSFPIISTTSFRISKEKASQKTLSTRLSVDLVEGRAGLLRNDSTAIWAILSRSYIYTWTRRLFGSLWII